MFFRVGEFSPLKEWCHKIYQNSNSVSGKCNQIEWNSKLTAQKVKREGIINTANTKGDADEQSPMRFKRMPILFSFFKISQPNSF